MKVESEVTKGFTELYNVPNNSYNETADTDCLAKLEEFELVRCEKG